MKQVTSGNAELFKLSGKLHPYQEGEIGVVKKGAYADILIVNKNPIEDVSVLTNPNENILFIMKDGVVFKNILE